MAKRLLTTREIAELTGFSETWFVMQRVRGTGPRYLRLGRGKGLVRYVMEDWQEYLSSCAVTPAHDAEAVQ